MKPLTLLTTLTLTLLSLPTSAATDPGDRTSMPSNCSDRDANCVINDGPPRKRSAVKKQEKEKEKEKRGNTPPGMDRSGGGPASGAIVDPAGVTRK